MDAYSWLHTTAQGDSLKTAQTGCDKEFDLMSN